MDRAIKKAAGAAASDDYAEVRYEGYGPAGVAVIVEALTDNRNRHRVGRAQRPSPSMAGRWARRIPSASCSRRCGVVAYRAEAASGDAMLEAAIEAGADDVTSGADGHEVICAPDTLFAVRDALERQFGAPEEAKFDWRPSTTVTLDEDRAVSVLKLIDALEENDDVQTVFANYDIPDHVAARLAE